MNFLFQNDLLFLAVFGLCVFTFFYGYTERMINFLEARTLGARDECMELLDRMLVKTDKKKLTTTMMLMSFGLGALACLAFWPNVIPGLIFGAVLTFGGLAMPKRILTLLWERRCSRLVDQMVDGMTIMANGVKSGLSITQSMERVVANMSGPLPQEFELVLGKVSLGLSVEEALNEFGDRIPKPDVQMFVTAVNILSETGGNLAETFETITYTVRERQKIEKKVEALTAQSMTQGMIITAVPFMLLVVFFLMDPGYVMPLFTKPLGWFFLFLMLALQVIGGVMMRKIATIKV